jgi:hypothetical protein
MQNSSPNIAFPTIHRIKQLTDYHCGPAVLVMLASYIGITINQNDIIKAAKVEKSYKKRGMTVPELGRGLLILHPYDIAFWYKNESTFEDIQTILYKEHYPVGIEWQGSFGEYSDDDNGHYSMCSAIDLIKRTITIADPFEYFAGIDRIFSLEEFNNRWWDINEHIDEYGIKKMIQDNNTIFIVTDDKHIFPSSLNLHKYTV